MLLLKQIFIFLVKSLPNILQSINSQKQSTLREYNKTNNINKRVIKNAVVFYYENKNIKLDDDAIKIAIRDITNILNMIYKLED